MKKFLIIQLLINSLIKKILLINWMDYEHLTHLDLSNKDLVSINGIGNLTNLTDLNLSNNQIDFIQAIESLNKLTDLDLTFMRRSLKTSIFSFFFFFFTYTSKQV